MDKYFYTPGSDKDMMRKYRERSNAYRPRRTKIYVNGEKQFVNEYSWIGDSPGTPFNRNYILMNASPHGMLHVSRRADVKHGWSPRFLRTDFSAPTTPELRKWQSTMELRKSEAYQSAEDLRYHNIRKAESVDNVLNHDYPDAPRSESGISVSDIDSIFYIDEDNRSQSSFGSADRSFSISEYDESNHDRLEVISEIEGNEDSGNQGSGTMSQAAAYAHRRLSHGMVNAGVLTEELLKLKEAQELRRHHKSQDIKAYLENNYPKRISSSTSADSCLGESIKSDIEQASDLYRFKSRRRLNYSTSSPSASRQESYRSRNDSDDFTTTKIETTLIDNLPGVFKNEEESENLNLATEVKWENLTKNSEEIQIIQDSTEDDVFKTKESNYEQINIQNLKSFPKENLKHSVEEETVTSVETIFIENTENVQSSDEINVTQIKNDYSEIKDKHFDSQVEDKSIENVYLSDLRSKWDKTTVENRTDHVYCASGDLEAISKTNFQSRNSEHSSTQENESLTCVEIIQSENNRSVLDDESSFNHQKTVKASSEFLINTTDAKLHQPEIAGQAQFRTENVFNRGGEINSVNVNRAEQNNTNSFLDQSEVSLHTTDVGEVIDTCSTHRYFTIDQTTITAHDTKTETNIGKSNIDDCTGSHTNYRFQIPSLTSVLNTDGSHLEEKQQVCLLNTDISRRTLSGEGKPVQSVTDSIQEKTDQRFDLKQDACEVNKEEIHNHNCDINTDNKVTSVTDNSCLDLNVLNLDNANVSLSIGDAQSQISCDNVKKEDQTFNEKTELEKGVDRKEHFIYGEVTRLEYNVDYILCSNTFKDTPALNTSNLQAITTPWSCREPFIDRLERFIYQSRERLLIKQNSSTGLLFEQVDSTNTSIDFSVHSRDLNNRCSDSTKVSTQVDSMSDKWQNNFSTFNSQVIVEDEEWDNPEDFKLTKQNGVRINVIKNKVPALTRYKMETISEHEEVDFNKSALTNRLHPLIEHKSITSNTIVDNGIETERTSSHNQTQFHSSEQRHQTSLSKMSRVNFQEMQHKDPSKSFNVTQYTTSRSSHSTQMFSSFQSSQHFKTSYHRNINSSEDFILPTDLYSPSKSVYISNLSYGEQGQQNMGKSFQFIRDRPESPEELSMNKPLSETSTSQYDVSWTQSVESLDQLNTSLMSSTSSIYQSSCSAEVGSPEDPGYTDNPQDDVDSFNDSFMSQESDGSTYKTVCTAEVSIEIPDNANEEAVSSKSEATAVLSPELSDAESGYYTLTKTGKVDGSSQDRTEDTTTYEDESLHKTVYKAQMFGEVEKDSFKSDSVLSSEDVNSFCSEELSSLTQSLHSSQTLSEGNTTENVSPHEDVTGFEEVQTLQDLLDFTAKLQEMTALEEEKLEMEDLTEEFDSSSYSIEAVAELSSDNGHQESPADNTKIIKHKKTIVEIFDSSEDLTGCIEFEVDDDTDISRSKNKTNVNRSSENLSRNLMTAEVATTIFAGDNIDCSAFEINSAVILSPVSKLKRSNSTEDITSFEKTEDITTNSGITEHLKSKIENYSTLQKPLRRANSSEDITSFEHCERNNQSSLIFNSDNLSLIDSRLKKHDESEMEDITSFVSNLEEQTEDKVTELTSLDMVNQQSLDEVDNMCNRPQNFEVNSSSRFLTDHVVTMEMKDSGDSSWIDNLDLSKMLSSTKMLKETVLDSGIDHMEKFESLSETDKNKIQMFIIYQDFAQLRERSRLKKELSLLSEQLEKLDCDNEKEKSTHLYKLDNFLDKFLENLTISENLDTFKSHFEKVQTVKTVQYYQSNSEMSEIMDKFSMLIHDLDMERYDPNLQAKLAYCLNFLKTKTLDAQFDSLCDFVCMEAEQEDAELLQNNLCLTKDGEFGSRRLLKYLGRGFSKDMKTLWKPKKRNNLQTLIEDCETDFTVTPFCDREIRGNKPCCEFHASDKTLCYRSELWLDSSSLNEVPMLIENKTRAFMN